MHLASFKNNQHQINNVNTLKKFNYLFREFLKNMEQYNDIFKRLDELVLCPICLQRFVSPKTLECQHTFCSKCLKSLHAKDQRLVCPICRRESHLNVTSTGNQNCALAQLNELNDEIKNILMQKAGEIRIVVTENVISSSFFYLIILNAFFLLLFSNSGSRETARCRFREGEGERRPSASEQIC